MCPCDYRDPDVEEYGTCYCALYVRKDKFEEKSPVRPIPERRPREKQSREYESTKVDQTKTNQKVSTTKKIVAIKKRLWYCRQCGYLVFREDPPYVCPICKAKRDLFAELEITVVQNS